MNKMNPDSGFAFQNEADMPDALRGTRQGLFYLLSRNPSLLAQRTEEEMQKLTAPRRAQPQPEVPPVSSLLAGDDFQFTF